MDHPQRPFFLWSWTPKERWKLYPFGLRLHKTKCPTRYQLLPSFLIQLLQPFNHQPKRTCKDYPPKVWKCHPGIGDSFWKPSFLGSALNLGRVSHTKNLIRSHHSISSANPRDFLDLFCSPHFAIEKVVTSNWSERSIQKGPKKRAVGKTPFFEGWKCRKYGENNWDVCCLFVFPRDLWISRSVRQIEDYD